MPSAGSRGSFLPADEKLLASWPKTFPLDLECLGDVLFCHATLRSDTEIFTRLTPEDRLLPVFGETGSSHQWFAVIPTCSLIAWSAAFAY